MSERYRPNDEAMNYHGGPSFPPVRLEGSPGHGNERGTQEPR